MVIVQEPAAMASGIQHYPVMYREVIDLLEIRRRRVVVDCTIGCGSHAEKFLEVMPRESLLVGIDRDQDSLAYVGERLKRFGARLLLFKSNFLDLDEILDKAGISCVDAFLFDLGVSSYQLSDPERGFSFLKNGDLDMRMDRDAFLSAYDLVNNLSERELAGIFRKFGQERYANRVARYIVNARKLKPISSTLRLAEIVARAVPGKMRRYKIHPATRVFQSLRIAVNRELEPLGESLIKAANLLNRGGRLAVISFHSLEDRIVKHTFRVLAREGGVKVIVKKPLTPTGVEVAENAPSRSAKLRVLEKV